jgi:hypothetical protein
MKNAYGILNYLTGKLTNAQIEEWRAALAKQPTARLLTDIVEAFRSAVAAIAPGTGIRSPGNKCP